MDNLFLAVDNIPKVDMLITQPTYMPTGSINEVIINSLHSLNDAHKSSKKLYFAKNLPFYTCVDSQKNQWTKELKSGDIYLVHRLFDFEQGKSVESVIAKIK